MFWCGDFNYRIDMGRDDVTALVAAGDWPALLSADQVRVVLYCTTVCIRLTTVRVTIAYSDS